MSASTEDALQSDAQSLSLSRQSIKNIEGGTRSGWILAIAFQALLSQLEVTLRD